MAGVGKADVDVGGDLDPLRRDLKAFAKSHRVVLNVELNVTATDVQKAKVKARELAEKQKKGLPKFRTLLEVSKKDVKAAKIEARLLAEKQKDGFPKFRTLLNVSKSDVKAAKIEARELAAAQKDGFPVFRAKLEVGKKEIKKAEAEAEGLAKAAPIDMPIRMDPGEIALKVGVAKELAEKALGTDPLEIPIELDEKTLVRLTSQLRVVKERAEQTMRSRMAIDTNRADQKIREIEARAAVARQRISRPIIMRVQSGLRGMRDDLSSLDRSFDRFVRSAIRGFNIVNAVGVAAFAGIVAYSTYQFAKVEAAATRASGVFASKVVAETRATGDEIIAINEKIRGEVLKTSKEVALSTKFDVEEAAEGIQFLAQAGVSQEAALKSVGTIAEFAQAANIDLQTATNDMAAGFIAAGGDVDLFGEKVDGFADKLVFVAQNAPISMEQTLSAFRNTAAATFEAFKQTEDEALNVIGLFGRSGFRGEMAGTQASILIREINRSALRKAPEAWKQLGIDVIDAEGKAVPFSKVLDQIASTLKDLQTTEGDKAFDVLKTKLDLTERSSRGLTQILPQVIKLQEKGSSAADEAARISAESAGRLGVQTEIVLQTLSLQFENFINGIQVIGQTFAGPFAKRLTDFFRQMNGDAEGSVDVMDRLAKKAGKLGEAFGRAMQPVLDQLRGPEGRELFGGLRDGFISLLRGISGMVTEFASAMGGGDGPVSTMEQLGFISRELGRVAEAVYPKVGRLLGQAFAFIRDNNETLASAAKGFLGLVVASKLIRVALLPLASAAAQVYKMMQWMAGSELLVMASRFLKWNAAAIKAGGSMQAITEFARGFGSRVPLVAVAIGAVKGAIEELDKALEPVNESLAEFGDSIGIDISGLGDVVGFVGGLAEALVSLGEALGGSAIRAAGVAIGSVIRAVSGGIKELTNLVTFHWKELGNASKEANRQIAQDTVDASNTIIARFTRAGGAFLDWLGFDDMAESARSAADYLTNNLVVPIEWTDAMESADRHSRATADALADGARSAKDQAAALREVASASSVVRVLSDAKEQTGALMDELAKATGASAEGERLRDAFGFASQAEAIRAYSREFARFTGNVKRNSLDAIKGFEPLATSVETWQGNVKDIQDKLDLELEFGVNNEATVARLRAELVNARNRLNTELTAAGEAGFRVDIPIRPQIDQMAVKRVQLYISSLQQQKRNIQVNPNIPESAKKELMRRLDQEIKNAQGFLDKSPLEVKLKVGGIDLGQIRPGTEFLAPGIREKQRAEIEAALADPTLVPSLTAAQREAYDKIRENASELAAQSDVGTTLAEGFFGTPDVFTAQSDSMQDATALALDRFFNNSTKVVRQRTTNIRQDALALGTSTIDGVTQGLMAGIVSVRRTGNIVARQVDAGFMDYMQIASPSKKMEERGLSVVDGLILGIDGSNPDVRKSLQGLAEVVTTEIDIHKPGMVLDAKTLGEDISKAFGQGLRYGWTAYVNPWLAQRRDVIRLMLDTLASSYARTGGTNVMRGFYFGMFNYWRDTVRPWVLTIAEWIKEHKGPIAYDAQLLRPAGEAIMGGFHRGLRDGFGEVQGWIKRIGPDMARHSIPDSIFKEMSADFLIGNASADLDFNPDEFFNSLLPTSLGGMGVAIGSGIFGQSSGFSDTVAQSKLIGQVFGMIPNIASSQRRVGDAAYNAAIGGAPASKHLTGMAMDFGLVGSSFSALTSAADWARQYIGTVFDEVLWQTTGHYDHLHLGWKEGSTKLFDSILMNIAGASEPVEAALQKASASSGVPFGLLAGLAKAESGFNPFATSPVGAQGLTQLMPATARSVGVLNSFDPFQNAEGGAKYLARQLRAFSGDVRLALAAYNAGPGAARVAINSYPETMAYIDRVLAFARQFGFKGFGGFRAQGGPTMPNTAYVVGERGPELFMSDRRGQVVSNSDMMAMVSAMRDGRMPTAQQPPVTMGDINVTTASKDPEVTAYLVDRAVAERMGRIQR